MGIRTYELRRKLANTEALRLKELNALKSRLYTNITHEFRTPLTVILGIADNIKGFVQERKLIRRNGENLLRLINQLLDLSKLDSGTMSMNMVQGDIIKYLRYLSESFYSMAQEKEIALTFHTAEERLEMDFDEGKIEHIVYNLLSNAIKFTKKGGEVKISVSRKKEKGQSWLLLSVEDTGQGIDPAQIPHIFDRFYQADNSTTRKGEGTGIGLALTKELITMMDGEIKVKSEQSKGTIFMVSLPAKIKTSPPKTKADFVNLPKKHLETTIKTTLDITGEGVEQSINRPLLLLIEDNKDVAAYIKTLLIREYEIITAINGQLGINKALEIIPDIIISDVMMPQKDGFEVCKTLKNDMRTSHIPIILLTAKAEQKDKIIGLQQGADAYLMKPFDKVELFVRLEKLLELRKALQKRYATSAAKPTKEVISKKPTLEDLFLQQLTAATEKIMTNPENAITNLQKAMHLSQMQLYRKLKALTGQTPSLFIRSVRLKKAKQLLKTTDLNVSEIAYEVGFTDPAYFSRAFNEAFGISPSSFRK